MMFMKTSLWLFVNLEYVGVDLKITRNHDNYVILEQLNETT